MIISVEPELAVLVELSGVEILFERGEPRADFIAEFDGVDFSQTRQLSYEPDRGIYHIVEMDYSLTVLSDPSEDPRMNYIHENKDAISTWMHEQYDAEQLAAQAALAKAELANSENT